MLTFSPEAGNTLLIALIAKSLDIADSAVPRASISMTVLQGIILLVVFYFMVNLYHLSHQVIRNYQYLGALEQEVRAQLNPGAESALFTREGTFYWKHRPPLWSCVRWTYIVLLGGLLTTFAGGRFYYDWRTGNVLAAMVNTTISFFTLCYFLAYAVTSTRLDKSPAN